MLGDSSGSLDQEFVYLDNTNLFTFLLYFDFFIIPLPKQIKNNMGYTHYFTPEKNSPLGKTYDEAWKDFIEDVKTLHKNLPSNVVIKGGDGTGEPIINSKEIWFNGDGFEGLDHETLVITKDELRWGFCKTAHKPYDLFVTAVLLAARHHLGFQLSSDGSYDEWLPGITFFVETLFDVDDVNEIVDKDFLGK